MKTAMAPDRGHDFRHAFFDTSTEYAFRALAELAAVDDEGVVRAEDLARRTGVPPAYLSKVMRRLTRGGLVRAQKGHGGGFQLARPPSTVPFSEVLRVLGQVANRDRCAFGWGRCRPSAPCALHPAWSALKQAFLAWANATTLADVAKPGAARAKGAKRR